MIGYPCLNLTLRKRGIHYSKTVKLSTFQHIGLEGYSRIASQNLDQLLSVLKWNEENGIRMFRISNGLFCHRNRYVIEDLPKSDELIGKLKKIGDFVKEKKHRLSFHADHYSILSSKREEVVENGLLDLEFFHNIFRHMGLPLGPYHKINVHVGSFLPNKRECADRFNKNFKRLTPETRSRITVENDDKKNGYTVEDLYEMIPDVPIVMDFLHHKVNNVRNVEDSLQLAASTWKGIRPVVHYSSSKKLYENNDSLELAHADHVYENVPIGNYDVMLESKAKELALFEGIRRGFIRKEDV